MFANLFQRRALAETGNIRVFANLLTAVPRVVGVGDAVYVLLGQVSASAVEHMAQFASVDEERFAPAVPVLSVETATAQEPEAGGYLSGPEELARQGDDAVHQAGFYDVLANLTLAGLFRRHGAVGKDETRNAAWRKVIQEVLHPGEVGIAYRRNTILPPPVVTQPVSSPVGDVERRIGEDVVGPQVSTTTGSRFLSCLCGSEH